MVDHSTSNWVLEGGGHRITLQCPRYIAGILSQVLSGWVIKRVDGRPFQEKLAVTFFSDRYCVDSIVLNKEEIHTDIISAINDLLVNLAYLIPNSDDSLRLVHCAAFVENGMMNIIVGKKNRGKSSFVYQKALAGNEIVADDLIIWQPKLGKFHALGLPLRLRRPVLTLEGKQANSSDFFAGHGIAYSKRHAFNIAQVGKEFLLDRLFELDQNFTPYAVSMLKTPAKLEEYIIGPEYTSLKKEILGK